MDVQAQTNTCHTSMTGGKKRNKRVRRLHSKSRLKVPLFCAIYWLSKIVAPTRALIVHLLLSVSTKVSLTLQREREGRMKVQENIKFSEHMHYFSKDKGEFTYWS